MEALMFIFAGIALIAVFVSTAPKTNPQRAANPMRPETDEVEESIDGNTL